ncbi:nucleic acid-binding protein [Atractiella rhizophila]|nr:nucleic acid-binding protein [Atractiella rhizophila]
MSRSGGGFMPGSQGGGDSPSGRRNTGNQTTRPVTIACLIKAEQPHPDAEFSIHGKELNSVTFVGIVRIAMDGSTHRSFTIEDGTGQIDVRQWIDQTDEAEDNDCGKYEGKYVRVVGTLKTFNSKRHITGTAIRILDTNDKNQMAEIMFHTIEAVHARRCIQSGLPKGRPGASSPNASRASGAKASDYSHQISASAEQTYNDAFTTVRSEYQKKIMRWIEELRQKGRVPGEGLNIGEIMRNVPGKGNNLEAVKHEVDELVEDGFLYTGHDENQ